MTEMEELLFHRPGGSVVKLDREALAQMLEFRQADVHREEAGGVLLGRRLLGSEDVVVDEVTHPLPGDFRHRTAFHRGAGPHQRIIDEHWQQSQGTCLYLGEWHTHPEPYPVPSLVDLTDWCRHLHHDHFDGDSLFFIIVGLLEVRAWEGFRRSMELVRLLPLGTRVR